jgi:hypothetical protein
MRLWRVAVDVKVPRGFRQLQLHPLQVLRQNDLTTKSRVFLQIRRHIQKIVFLLRRFGKLVKVIVEDVDMTSRAGKRSFTSSFHLDAVAMGEVKNVVANFSSDVEVFSVLVSVCYVDAGDGRRMEMVRGRRMEELS